MPTFSCFATTEDGAAIAAFMQHEFAFAVLEAYSWFDRPLRQLEAPESVLAAYQPVSSPDGPPCHLHLAFWRADLGPQPSPERIELQPGAVLGASCWHAFEGCGILYLGVPHTTKGRLPVSTLSVNSEARARKWERPSADRGGPVAAWNWPETRRAAQRARYHIVKRLAVAKTGSRPILPEATRLAQAGIQLVEV